MRAWHLPLAMILICAALWWWMYIRVSFTADQVFWGDTALTNGLVAIAVAALYFVILPVAVVVFIVLLLVRLWR